MIPAIENKKLVIRHETGVVDSYDDKQLEKIKIDITINQVQSQIEYERIDGWIKQIKE